MGGVGVLPGGNGSTLACADQDGFVAQFHSWHIGDIDESEIHGNTSHDRGVGAAYEYPAAGRKAAIQPVSVADWQHCDTRGTAGYVGAVVAQRAPRRQ